MGVDIISLVMSIISLLQLLCKIRHASEERKYFVKTLDDTTHLLARVKQSFSHVASHIAKDEREWIESILKHSEMTLTEARKVIGNAGLMAEKKRRRPLRRLRWVLENKEAAGMHMGVISQHHLTLMVINFRLVVERRLCVHAEMFGGSSPPRYSAMRQEVSGRLKSHRPSKWLALSYLAPCIDGQQMGSRATIYPCLLSLSRSKQA
jgi:hypothetical protein